MRLKISHSTTYRFDEPSLYGLQQIRKTPKSGAGQELIAWQSQITGGRKELEFDDHMGNRVELISFDKGTTELRYTSEGEVELTDLNGVVGRHRGPARLWLFKRSTPLATAGRGVKALAREVTGETSLERLHSLSAIVHGAVTYELGASQPDWDAETALAAGKGVCQDHTHIFLAAARTLGIPARYVSGYLLIDGETQQDAMHAWAEAHVDGLGWVGFDVSNQICPDTRYVRVATGLDYRDAAPIRGSQVGGAGESLAVKITVAQQ